MQDVFIEYMVARRRSGKTLLLKALIALCGACAAVMAFVLSSFLGPFSMLGALVAVGAVYGAYYLITSQNIEYEYALTNGEMDVDKIVAQRKRTRLLSVKVKEVEAFGPYRESEHQGKNYGARIFACDDRGSDGLWYLVCRQREKGQTLLVFNANDRLIEGLKPYLPKPILHDVFRRGQ